MSIRQMQMDTARAQSIKDILQIGYDNIQIITDSVVVYGEDRDYTLLEFGPTGEIINRQKKLKFHKWNNVKVISYQNKVGERKSLVNISDKVVYTLDTPFIMHRSKYRCHLLYCGDWDDSAVYLVVIHEDGDDILISGTMKEPALEPYSSPARLQFILENGNTDKLYGLDINGNLMENINNLWKYKGEK